MSKGLSNILLRPRKPNDPERSPKKSRLEEAKLRLLFEFYKELIGLIGHWKNISWILKFSGYLLL